MLMANPWFKLWYKRPTQDGEQMELFSDNDKWIGPMFMPGSDSEDAVNYLQKLRPEMTIKVTGKWRKHGDRFR